MNFAAIARGIGRGMLALTGTVLFATQSTAAVPWSAEAGATRVVLVATDEGAIAELTRLSQVLLQFYGAAPDTIVPLFGSAARADDVERALFQMASRTSRRDTLVVVLALALHDRGRDRVLITADFDPARPWTGLTLDLLQKFAAGGVAGTYWQFAPGCARASKGGYEQFANSVKGGNAYAGDNGIGVTAVTFCEAEGAAPGREFARLLAATLQAAAEGRKGGAVTTDEVLGRLTKGARGMEVRADHSLGASAVLQLRPMTSEPNARELRAALERAQTDNEAIAVLDRAVAQGRAAQDPAHTVDIANSLAAYAIDPSADVTRRARTIQALGSLPPTEARPALERVFAGAGEGLVRAAALREWQRIAKPNDNSLLHQALGETEPVVQIAALHAAASANDKSATDAVVKSLMKAADPQVRGAAARALIAVAEPSVAQNVLIGALADPAETVRAEVASSLGQLALTAAAAGPLLKAVHSDASALVRESACYALAAVWPQLSGADREAIERQLLDIAADRAQAEGVRVAALYTVARGGSVLRGDRLVNIARRESEPPALRKTALEAIGLLKITSTSRALTDIARNPKERTDLRIAATAALGDLPDSAAADALWALSASESVDVAAVARRALEQGKTFSPAAAAVVADVNADPERRAAATRLLGNAIDPRAFELLIRTLADSRREIRDAAIASLSRFKEPAYIDRLAQVLASASNPGRETHEGAAYALATMDSELAREILVRHVAATDNDVRQAVAIGLGTAKPTRAGFDALAHLARDESDRVREATAVSLGRVENFPVASVLEPMSKDEDTDVRAAAVEALRTARARGTPSQRF